MPAVTRSASKGLRPPFTPGADGTDGDYRMTIDPRYKKQASKRAALQWLAYGNVALGLLLCLWQALPKLTSEGKLQPLVAVLAVSHLAALAAYVLGTGTAKKQGPLLLRAYAGVCGALTLQVGLMMYLDAKAAPDSGDNVHLTAAWLQRHLRHLSKGTAVHAVLGLDVFLQLLAGLLPLACIFATLTLLHPKAAPKPRRRGI